LRANISKKSACAGAVTARIWIPFGAISNLTRLI
jgi:hypothetical protein